MPSSIRLNMVNVDSREFKRHILDCIDQAIRIIENSIMEKVVRKNERIKGELETMSEALRNPILSCRELFESEQRVDSFSC